MKRHFLKIICLFFALAIVMLIIQYNKSYEKWTEDYQQILDKGKDNGYILYDINGDEVPELIYDNCIYYYNSINEIQFETDVFYEYADLNYPLTITANGIMCLSGGTDLRTITIYSMVDDTIDRKLIIVGMKSDVFNWYKVNGEERAEITLDESNEIQSQYGTEKLYFISKDIPIKEAAISMLTKQR